MESDRKFLLPGEYAVTKTTYELATLLGSCVSVTLWHPIKHYAAMNHFLLPESQNSTDSAGRYGNTSTNLIIKLISKFEPDVKQLHAGIYGGGAVLGHLGNTNVRIGERNIEIARRILEEHGIKVVEEKTGGTNGKRIDMDTMTGKVSVRQIEKTSEGEALRAQRLDIASRKTRVLIVDDSKLVRTILRKAIESTPDMEVCGEAEDAFEARNLILEQDPDVISLDIIMPRMTGLEFLKILSKHYPKPVVICSTIAKTGSDIAQKAREYGALVSVDKDKLQIYSGLDKVREFYIPRIRKAAFQVVKKKIFD